MRRLISNATGPSSRQVSGRKGLEVLALTVLAMACLSVHGYAQDELETVVCESQDGEREECAAETSAGVVLMRATGPTQCLLGKSWGYDEKGIWVVDGCGGEFAIGMESVPDTLAQQEEEEIETWGTYDPGEGFLVGRSKLGELKLSAYALVRYLNQMDDDEVFTDHLGNERPVDPRQDISSHRVMVFLKGWLASPKFRYLIFLWTVNATDQDAILGSIGYNFSRKFSLWGGVNGTPGSRSLWGSHPYWLGHDRVMADEFFRPYFTYGIWANGELIPGLWYGAQVGNNGSSIGITASQLDRKMQTIGGSVWWMPTTHEFGPRGAYGDWEHHEELATRFGFSAANSPEERHSAITESSKNTTLKLADGLNVFDTGSLAPGVTVEEVDYSILSFDAGMKYRGVFLQAEYYSRWLNNFHADGPLPVEEIFDHGFYVQAAFYPIPKTLELYGATSQIFGDDDAGFDNSSEYLSGVNVYPFETRNHRWNLQVMDVNNSPAGSTFGYYVGGQEGVTVTTAFSIFF